MTEVLSGSPFDLGETTAAINRESAIDFLGAIRDNLAELRALRAQTADSVRAAFEAGFSPAEVGEVLAEVTGLHTPKTDPLEAFREGVLLQVQKPQEQ